MSQVHEDEGAIEVKEDDIVSSHRYPKRAEGVREAVDVFAKTASQRKLTVHVQNVDARDTVV